MAPNRIFNIEYRTSYYNTNTMLNYEVRLYEGQTAFDVIYGTIAPIGAANDSALTVGVQKNTTVFTSVGCDSTGGQAPPVSSGQLYHYTLAGCPSPTATPATTPTATPTATATATGTPSPSPTRYSMQRRCLQRELRWRDRAGPARRLGGDKCRRYHPLGNLDHNS